MFNTPNTFGIFALDRMLAWLERQGGVDAINRQNKTKAESIYTVLDSSEFWVPHAEKNSRSIMNITWRLADTDLEAVLLQEADKQHLKGLKGHRSVGGLHVQHLQCLFAGKRRITGRILERVRISIRVKTISYRNWKPPHNIAKLESQLVSVLIKSCQSTQTQVSQHMVDYTMIVLIVEAICAFRTSVRLFNASTKNDHALLTPIQVLQLSMNS